MFVAKIQILLNGSLVYVHPVLMKSVDEFRVKGRSKNFEVGVPLRTAQKDDVVTCRLVLCRLRSCDRAAPVLGLVWRRQNNAQLAR